MVLKREVVKLINEFVFQKPRTIQEVAQHINSSWVTTDRYIQQIMKEEGTISLRTFRGGTRGALKIAYWNHPDQTRGSSRFQEKLLNSVRQGKDKNDFSPFDIYQYVPEDKRYAFISENEHESILIHKFLTSAFKEAKEQLLIFAGRMKWVDANTVKILEELAERGVSIKILTRVEIGKLEHIKEVDGINERLGKDVIDIRHCEQPLRAFVIDNSMARFKEFKEETGTKSSHVFYTIHDQEWIEWTKNVFWQYSTSAIPARKRIKDMESIRGGV